MIESLVKVSAVTKRPYRVFFLGALFCFVAAFLTSNVYLGEGSGFLTVAFISIPAAPFFITLFVQEERKRSGNIFQRHFDVIEIYAYFTLSLIFASSFLYVILPNGEQIFYDQSRELERFGITGAFATVKLSFEEILWNNSKVLLLTFLFSFLLGAGAVFLISWNSTIIGVLVGKIAKNPSVFGLPNFYNPLINYIFAFPYTLLSILPHGIFEFAAYFCGAVAGGILSAGLMREENMKDFLNVFSDALAYLSLSFVLVLIGAVIEVLV